MECKIKHDKKAVYIWITKKESEQKGLRKELIDIIPNDYSLIEFISGNSDIKEDIKKLVLQNI